MCTTASAMSCLLSLALLLPFLPLHSAVVSSRVTANLLVLYTFQEGQLNINATSTLDQSRENLLPAVNLPSLSSAWSAQRQGLTLTGLYDGSTTPSPSLIQSSAIVSYLKVNLASSYSVEAFLTPASLGQQGVVLGFGGWDPTTPDRGGCMGGGSGWRDWYWYQNGSSLTTVMSHGGGTPGCSSVTVALSASAVVHHVVTSVAVLSASTANVSCYYNGQLVLSTVTAQTSFQQWQSTNYLQLSSARLAAPAAPNRTWSGSLYLFAMYSPALTAAAVATNYQSYLPNSAPVLASLAQSVTVLQNSTANALTAVSFNASDYDGDSILYRVVAMPAKGTLTLFDPAANATTLLTTGEVFYLSSPQMVFQYSPLPGEWNASYAVFSFAACDLSVCGVPAVVTVSVQHIVTPPVPVSQAVSLLSGATVVVALTGVDVDGQAPLHSNMTSARLLSLPVNGLLYVWNGTAASPATPLNASSILTLNASASPQCPLCVLYVPTTPLSSTNGSAYNDSFAFAVATKNTSSAANATVTLTVANPLTAQPVTAALLGDAPVYFSLYGASALRTAFSYLAVTLPQKGNLTLQNGQPVALYTPGSSGSGAVNGSVALWSTSQMVFTSAVSVYAGVYNSSLDPVSDSFTYSLLDAAGNHAAVTTVTILYPPIHHAQSILTAFASATSSDGSPFLAVNTSAPSQDAATWTVIPYAIEDPDALPTSPFAVANPTNTFQYDVVISLSPPVGALVRLDPARTVIVTVVSGLATGSASVAFTCGLAACNAVLAGVQLQANAAKSYNLTISTTQVDTGTNVQSTSAVVASTPASATSTGASSSTPPSSSSNPDSLSSIFAPTSKWFWITIAAGVGVLVLMCVGWKWRRARRVQRERKQEITSVAVELAKAVGTDKKEATAEIEARAEKRTLDTIANFQALSSPRMHMALDQASFAQTQGMPYLQSPMAGAGMMMSPRSGMGGGGGGGGGMYGIMPASPSSSQYQQAATPRSIMLGLGMAEEQWMAQQQMAQLADYHHMMASSPRLAMPSHPFSPSVMSASPRSGGGLSLSSTQPIPAVPSPRQSAAAAATAPAAASKRFSFGVTQPLPARPDEEEDAGEVTRPRLSLMVTPAEEPEPPIMPQLRDFIV